MRLLTATLSLSAIALAAVVVRGPAPSGAGLITIGIGGTYELDPVDPNLDTWNEVFQRAVDDLPAGQGGVLRILGGTYAFTGSTPVTITENRIAILGGPGSVLTTSGGTTTAIAFFDVSGDDFTLRGPRLVLAGPAAPVGVTGLVRVTGEGFRLQDCTFDVFPHVPATIELVRCDRQGPTAPFRFGTLIEGNTFIFGDTGQSNSQLIALHLKEGSGTRILSNHFRPRDGGTFGRARRAVWLESEFGSTVVGNTVENLDVENELLLVSRSVGEGHHLVVDGNSFKTCRAECVLRFDEVAFAAVSGNTFSEVTGVGIDVFDGASLSISGNRFFDVHGPAGEAAIVGSGTLRSVSVVGNSFGFCRNPQVVFDQGVFGIHVVANQFDPAPDFGGPTPIDTAVLIDDTLGGGGHFLHGNTALSNTALGAPNARFCRVVKVIDGMTEISCDSGSRCSTKNNFNVGSNCP